MTCSLDNAEAEVATLHVFRYIASKLSKKSKCKTCQKNLKEIIKPIFYITNILKDYHVADKQCCRLRWLTLLVIAATLDFAKTEFEKKNVTDLK